MEAGHTVLPLIAEADVLIITFKSATLDKWGKSYAALSETSLGLMLITACVHVGRSHGFGVVRHRRDGGATRFAAVA